MDHINIGSKFTLGIISKILKKLIKKSYGIDAELIFDQPLDLRVGEEYAELKVNVVAKIHRNDLNKLTELI